MSPPAPTLADQQRAFDAFRRVSDEERPHEALGQRPPASRYAPSPRPCPDKVASPEYAAGVEVRRVRGNGEIKWAGERIFLSEALIGEPVGLVWRDDRLWTVRFGHLEIGRLDGYALRIIKTPVRALPMYPVGHDPRRKRVLRSGRRAPHPPPRPATMRRIPHRRRPRCPTSSTRAAWSRPITPAK